MRINSVVLNVFVLIYKLNFVLVTSSSKIDQLHAANIPPCRACRTLVDSFNKGFERTSKSKFEGGDTAWEEEKLGSYATSEIRLVEIQENLCKDIEEGRNQCFSLAEQHDSLFEDWWFKYQKQQPNLQNWLCIESLKVCCPDNHFGLECEPCPGYPDVCSNNGKCKGAGTRKGNGMCICDTGYAGHNCSECAVKYYVAYKDDKKLLCSKCHVSCDGSCTGAGHKGCMECAPGWSMEPERGCLDVNECAFEKSPCGRSQFCVNTEGSFKCLDCDRACSGCSGDGPDMCDECTTGYSLIDNVCMDTSQRKMTSYVNFTRYLTYIGLCVATCIILQRNLIIAAVVGLVVALYISVSEYMLSTRSDSSDSIIDSDSLLRAIG